MSLLMKRILSALLAIMIVVTAGFGAGAGHAGTHDTLMTHSVSGHGAAHAHGDDEEPTGHSNHAMCCMTLLGHCGSALLREAIVIASASDIALSMRRPADPDQAEGLMPQAEIPPPRI